MFDTTLLVKPLCLQHKHSVVASADSVAFQWRMAAVAFQWRMAAVVVVVGELQPS